MVQPVIGTACRSTTIHSQVSSTEDDIGPVNLSADNRGIQLRIGVGRRTHIHIDDVGEEHVGRCESTAHQTIKIDPLEAEVASQTGPVKGNARRIGFAFSSSRRTPGNGINQVLVHIMAAGHILSKIGDNIGFATIISGARVFSYVGTGRQLVASVGDQISHGNSQRVRVGIDKFIASQIVGDIQGRLVCISRTGDIGHDHDTSGHAVGLDLNRIGYNTGSTHGHPGIARLITTGYGYQANDILGIGSAVVRIDVVIRVRVKQLNVLGDNGREHGSGSDWHPRRIGIDIVGAVHQNIGPGTTGDIESRVESLDLRLSIGRLFHINEELRQVDIGHDNRVVILRNHHGSTVIQARGHTLKSVVIGAIEPAQTSHIIAGETRVVETPYGTALVHVAHEPCHRVVRDRRGIRHHFHGIMNPSSAIIHEDARDNPVAVKSTVHIRSGLQSDRVIIPANCVILIWDDIAIRVRNIAADKNVAESPAKTLRRSQSQSFSQAAQRH